MSALNLIFGIRVFVVKHNWLTPPPLVVRVTSRNKEFRKSGYFDPLINEKPLLHTWSLAVEEQYYLFFPMVVVLFWKIGKNWLISFIAIVAIASLLLAQFQSINNLALANFYLIFSRAWELFFGAMIVFFLSKQPLNIKQWHRQAMSTLGFMLIVYSIVNYNEKTPFPGFYALLPVLGACWIICFADSSTRIGHILANKILVYIGLMSYSLYLWHQPIFAFLRVKSIGDPSKYIFIMAIFITVILSVFSWRYIETPFRNKVRFTQATIFKYAAVSLAMFMGIGLVGYYYKGFDSRFSTTSYEDSMEQSKADKAERVKCQALGEDYLKPTQACKSFNNITWASFGDSQSIEPAFALSKRLKANNQGLVHLSFNGCQPALLFDVKEPGCSAWIKESVDYLVLDKEIKNVLLVFRFSQHLYGSQLASYPNTPDNNPADYFINILQPISAKEAREIYWKSFEAIVKRLLQSGKSVYIMYPIPELPIDIHKAVAPFTIFSNDTVLDLNKSSSVDYYKVRNEFILSKLDSLKYDNKLHAIKPLEIFCDDKYCPAVIDGRSLYYDDNHLSASGAELVIENINLK